MLYGRVGGDGKEEGEGEGDLSKSNRVLIFGCR